MRRGIIGRIILALIAVACVTTASALYFTDRTAIDQEKILIEELATVTAGMISAVGSFDQTHSANDHPEGSAGATLSQVRNAMKATNGFGATGEILVLQDDGGDSLRILIHQKREGQDKKNHPDRIPKNSSYAAPFLAALAGKAGSMVTVDHRGEEVLIAYAPVRSMNWAVAAEIDTSELTRPLLDSALPTLVIASLIAAFGAIFAYRQTSQVIGALEAEEQKFQDFAESASDWLWMQDENFRFVSLGVSNRPDDAITEERIVGKVREEFAAEDTNSQKWRKFRTDLEARRPFRNFIYSMRTLNGPPISVSISGVPVFDAKGNFKGYRGTGSNVDPILKRDKMLVEAEERLRIAFNSMTVGVILISETGKIRFFNPKAEEMFGYTADEVENRNVSILMPEPDHSRHDTYLRSYLDTGSRKIIGIGREVRGRRKDDTTFPLHLGVSELELDGKRHFIGALTDLSTVKTLESQLRRATKLDAIGQLSGGIAHDFNNLLGIILGNLELMQRKLEPDSKFYSQVGKAITAAQRGVKLTRQLLNFSRQSPELHNPVPVDVNDTISGLNDLLSRSLTASIKLEIHLAQDLPSASTDRGELEDALVNLIVNARDALPDGGSIVVETSTITFSRADNLEHLDLAPGLYVQISVADTGCGMSKATIEKAFEPFFTTKAPGKGTGLGLPMVYGFVKRSGGHIAIYSEEGVGSTFRIYLPAVPDTPAAPPASGGEAAAVRRGGGESILVVDDEVALTDIARSILQGAGYSVLATASTKEALAILASDTAIDLLFTDLIMPGSINGIDLARAAEIMRPEVRVLMTSGFTGKLLDKQNAARLTSGLLHKPYSEASLTSAVRARLDRQGR